MRIIRVTSSDPACQPNCPEWISAEGGLRPGTGAAFARTIADLNGRRLPVLISSRGGALDDALAMGRLIREKGLPVAIARTMFDNCPEGAPACPGAKGQAITGGAHCASACTLILIGGAERLVGPSALVGVHQITAILKRPEGSERLTTVKKFYEPQVADEAVGAYLASMGVGDPVMTLLRKTPASSIRWLSLDEMKASRLATLALDASSPILTSGANGLNGQAFAGAGPGTLLTARAADGSATLSYRPGGGVVELATAAKGGAAALIPRERFCAEARDGGIVASDSGEPAKAPIAFRVSDMDGAGAVILQACP